MRVSLLVTTKKLYSLYGRPLVGPSVHLSVGPLVFPSFTGYFFGDLCWTVNVLVDDRYIHAVIRLLLSVRISNSRLSRTDRKPRLQICYLPNYELTDNEYKLYPNSIDGENEIYVKFFELRSLLDFRLRITLTWRDSSPQKIRLSTFTFLAHCVWVVNGAYASGRLWMYVSCQWSKDGPRSSFNYGAYSWGWTEDVINHVQWETQVAMRG